MVDGLVYLFDVSWILVFVGMLLSYLFFWLVSSKLLRLLVLWVSLFVCMFSFVYWMNFDSFIMTFQFCIFWFSFVFFGFDYDMGFDGVSIIFIWLTGVLSVFCVVVCWNLGYKLREFLLVLLVMEFVLVKCFCILDLFFFYIFFESLLLPMFVLMGVWGSSERKVLAAYSFFFYTLLGSVCMLLSMVSMWCHLGSTNLWAVSGGGFSLESQVFVFLFFFLGLAMKIPMYPVHIWLPEAHVEAPTSGSVILAGVLLKLGTYAMFRYLLPVFPAGALYLSPCLISYCIVGLLFSACVALVQMDLKKLVAYSSIAHMNLMVVGLMSYSFQGVEGSLVAMLSHGFVSSAFFFSVGLLYDSYSTSDSLYYGGLAALMPVFSSLLFVFLMGNISFPGTSGFVGEFLLCTGILLDSVVGIFALLLGIFPVTVFSLVFYNRVIFGSLGFLHWSSLHDLTLREFSVLFILCLLVLIFGLFPKVFLDVLGQSVLLVVLVGLVGDFCG